MESPTRERRCPVCHREGPHLDHLLPELMRGAEERFAYAECRACGSLWCVEPPADLARYYGGDYYSVEADPTLRYRSLRQRVTKRAAVRAALGRFDPLGWLFLRLSPYPLLRQVGEWDLGELGEDARILDVGCGSGELVHLLWNAGFHGVMGIDPFLPDERVSPEAPPILRRSLEELPDEPFDRIMFHHSFEHVPDPDATLAEVRRRLAPGGVCILRIPTVSSRAWEEYREHWIQADAPRHLFLFSVAGLEATAARAGLRIEKIVDDSTGFQFWGSEQARRGIPLFAPESLAVDPGAGTFPPEQLRDWEERARELNSRREGDQFAAYLVDAGPREA